MTHEALQERLLDLAYGELSPRDAREVQEHVRSCDACRTELARIEGTRRTMSALGPEAAPAGGDRILAAAAREAVRGRVSRRSVPRWLWGGTLAAASVAAAVAVSLKLGEVARPPSLRDDPDVLLGERPYAAPPAAEPGRSVAGAGPEAGRDEVGAAPADAERFASPPEREATGTKKAAPQRRAPAPSPRAAAPAPPPASPPAASAAPPPAPSPSATPPSTSAQADRAAPRAGAAGVVEDRPSATQRKAEAAPKSRAEDAPGRAAAAPAPAMRSRSMAQAPEAAPAAPDLDDSRSAGIAWYEEMRRSGKLTAEVREFPGCARESWRRIERDPAGRIVSYSWRGDEGGARFEVIYLPNGRGLKRGFDPQTGEPDPFVKFRAPRPEELDIDAPSACERSP